MSEQAVVVFVSVSRFLAGPGRSVLTLLECPMPSSQRPVFLVPPGELKDAASRLPGIDVVELPFHGRFRKASRLNAMLVSVTELWKRRRTVSAVHANGLAEFSVVAPAALMTRSRIVVWSHASVIARRTAILGRIWAKIIPRVRWAAVSPESAAVLASALGVEMSRIHIIPNPIATGQVVGDRAARGDSEQRPMRIGYLSGATRAKGFDVLIEVATMLADRDVEWLLFTNLESQRADPSLVAAARRLDCILPVGRVEDVAEAYSQIDIVFMPSRAESFSRVVAEAIMNGLPVVASDLGPTRRLLAGESDLLFPPGDPAAAAQRLSALIDDASNRERAVQRAAQGIAALDPSAVRETFDRIYQE